MELLRLELALPEGSVIGVGYCSVKTMQLRG